MATGAESGSGGGGLPQLNFETWPSQIFWLIVALLTLYVVLGRVIGPRISATIEERADTIAGDLDLAEEYNQKAVSAEAAHVAALDAARTEARAIAEKTQAEIKAQLDAALAEADQRIAAKTAESQERIAQIEADAAAKAREVAGSAAAALVARFNPGAVDDAALSAAVDAEISARFAGGAR